METCGSVGELASFGWMRRAYKAEGRLIESNGRLIDRNVVCTLVQMSCNRWGAARPAPCPPPPPLPSPKRCLPALLGGRPARADDLQQCVAPAAPLCVCSAKAVVPGATHSTSPESPCSRQQRRTARPDREIDQGPPGWHALVPSRMPPPQHQQGVHGCQATSLVPAAVPPTWRLRLFLLQYLSAAARGRCAPGAEGRIGWHTDVKAMRHCGKGDISDSVRVQGRSRGLWHHRGGARNDVLDHS